MKNILGIFAGRKTNLEILIKYLRKAIDLKILDEIHFWNNTRNTDDEDYIKTITNLKRTSSAEAGIYNQIFTPIVNNQFSFKVIATNDVHVKITNKNTEYEIILGGWKNTRSVIRKDNKIVSRLDSVSVINPRINNFTISVADMNLNIYKDNTLLMTYILTEEFTINNIYFKTGHSCVGDFMYDTIKNNNFYFMDTCEKSWKNFYSYYDKRKYINDIDSTSSQNV